MKKNMAKVTKIKAEQHQSVLRKIQNVVITSSFYAIMIHVCVL